MRPRPLVLAVILGLSGPPLAAQEQEGRVVIAPPVSDSGQVYRQSAARAGIRSGIAYSDAFDPDAPPPERPAPSFQPSKPVLTGPVGIFVTLGLLFVGIFVWARFGGGGMLLAAAPAADRPRKRVPEGWEDSAPAGGPVLDRIAAMQDRRAALIHLLRQSLIHAADITDTRFARSDTERLALQRLPADLVRGSGLDRLTRVTELAHYGGREVDETQFSECLSLARALLARKAGGADA